MVGAVWYQVIRSKRVVILVPESNIPISYITISEEISESNLQRLTCSHAGTRLGRSIVEHSKRLSPGETVGSSTRLACIGSHERACDFASKQA